MSASARGKTTDPCMKVVASRRTSRVKLPGLISNAFESECRAHVHQPNWVTGRMASFFDIRARQRQAAQATSSKQSAPIQDNKLQPWVVSSRGNMLLIRTHAAYQPLRPGEVSAQVARRCGRPRPHCHDPTPYLTVNQSTPHALLW